MKKKPIRDVKGETEAPLPPGKAWAYDTIEKIKVTNTGKATINMIVGGELHPGCSVTLSPEALRENLPWLNGQKVSREIVRETRKRVRDLVAEAEQARLAQAIMEAPAPKGA